MHDRLPSPWAASGGRGNKQNNMKGNTMTDMLQEFCDSRGVSMCVDRQAGVIRGVKLLGLESRNGRTYLPEALARAVRLYENAKVNVNHPKGHPNGPRDYQDRIGTIREVSLHPGEGLFGDFHFNPKHALAEQLIWDAEHAPENVGFSHNVEAKMGRQGDRVVVEAITRVQSVDLVADPATTRGLFESADPEVDATEAAVGDSRPTIDDLRRDYPELIESIRQEQTPELDRLRREVDRLAALESDMQKKVVMRRLLGEFGLPDPDAPEPWAKTVTSERFVESLLAAPDTEAMRLLVEERAQLVRAIGRCDAVRGSDEGRPQSRDQHAVYPACPTDTKRFVEAITSR
jgi:hypothetical protein